MAYLTKGKGTANGTLVADGDLVRGDTLSFEAFEDVQLIVVWQASLDNQLFSKEGTAQ